VWTIAFLFGLSAAGPVPAPDLPSTAAASVIRPPSTPAADHDRVQIHMRPAFEPLLAKGLNESSAARALWQRLRASRAYVRVLWQPGLGDRLYSTISFAANGIMIQNIYYPTRFQTRAPDGSPLDGAVAALFHEFAHGVELLREREVNQRSAVELLRRMRTAGRARFSEGGRHETPFALHYEAEVARDLRAASQPQVGAAKRRGYDRDGAEPASAVLLTRTTVL
jgi:hypothetical protein